MRKNLLVATLVGLCVVGLTACSRSEENRGTDNTTTTASAQAPENQAVTQPESVANSAQPADQSAPAQPATGVNPDQNPTTTTDNSSTVPTPSDATTAPAADNNTSTTTN